MDNLFSFIGGSTGQWKVINMNTVVGDPISPVSYLSVIQGFVQPKAADIWRLQGFTSNIRYTGKDEKEQLTAIQEGLGRPAATYAALIPIRKSEAWWNLAQDERRKIFENQSQHTQTGLKYLPAIARKLHHCRDIGEPFDFLTWFEYAPADAPAFDELLRALRQSEEWNYVEREVDIRLVKV